MVKTVETAGRVDERLVHDALRWSATPFAWLGSTVDS